MFWSSEFVMGYNPVFVRILPVKNPIHYFLVFFAFVIDGESVGLSWQINEVGGDLW